MRVPQTFIAIGPKPPPRETPKKPQECHQLLEMETPRNFLPTIGAHCYKLSPECHATVDAGYEQLHSIL
jgi:hypothetical protein